MQQKEGVLSLKISKIINNKKVLFRQFKKVKKTQMNRTIYQKMKNKILR